MRTLLTILSFLAILYSPLAQAEDSKPSETVDIVTKEDFIKAWEEHIKSLPTTVKFENTDQKNIYSFETTLFPFNGQLKLLNVIIREQSFFDEKDTQNGIAEIELLDIPDDFFKNREQTEMLWKQEHVLFFIPKPDSKWVTQEEWFKKSIEKSKKKSKASSGCSFSEHQEKTETFQDNMIKKLDETIELQKQQNDLLKQLLEKK